LACPFKQFWLEKAVEWQIFSFVITGWFELREHFIVRKLSPWQDLGRRLPLARIQPLFHNSPRTVKLQLRDELLKC
jgi:hypothetical protein